MVKDGTFWYLDSHARVEQGDTGGSVILVVSGCGGAHMSVNEPPVTYNLCLGLGDLSARLGFSRAAGVADLQPTDSVSVVSEEKFVRAESECLWVVSVFNQCAGVRILMRVLLLKI